jgi:hypothetical protein
MDLSFALLFLGAAGANFYFLLRSERVQSLLMLRSSWAALGLSLIGSAFGGTSKLGPEMLESLMFTRGISLFFLGISYLLIPFIVHPIELRSTANVRPYTPNSERQIFSELAEIETQPEAAPLVPPSVT